MKKIIMFLLIIFIIPISVNAVSKDYVDKVYDIVDKKVDSDKINIYLFRGEGCPHCADEEKKKKKIEDKYNGKINIYDFEVWNNKDNAKKLDKVRSIFNSYSTGVPFTVIGDNYYVGYSNTIRDNMESAIDNYLDDNTKVTTKKEEKKMKLPIIGNVDVKKVSVPLVAVILGFIDGFNPCAMWILLFLINMLFRVENKKKAYVLGFTFLFISALVYFLSMLGINFVISIVAVKWLKIALALFILIAGILNLKKYLKIRKEEAGCTIVDSKKRKKLSSRMRKIIESKSFLLSLIGIAVLAASVNLIELACSLGFPMIFSEILSINNIVGVSKIIYLVIYIIFYMIDDILVFTISMITLNATGITNKYNKLCTLVSSIIMILIGLLLIFKPNWLMMNF